MTDIILYGQLIMLGLNIIVFCFLMKEHELEYKFVRILILVAISIGAVMNFGKVTIVTVLLMFTPFITLLKIQQHGKFYRYLKRIGDSFRGHRKSVQKLQRDNKALSHKEA